MAIKNITPFLWCGWLKDRFGLSWQINYAGLPDLLSGPRADRVMAAMMKMTKTDIAGLEEAAAVGELS